jgi:FKBP-type peptidyl-prolyl cis-trans isomerase FklB
MTHLLMIVFAAILFVPEIWAQDIPPLKDQKAKDSYSLGYEFGSNLKRQEVEVDTKVLMEAIQEGLTGRGSVLTTKEMAETLKELRRKVMVQGNRRFERLARDNLEKGKAFLAANKTKEGIQVLASGLQYRVLREGNGSIPRAGDMVVVNYRGTLIDGTQFDSTQGKPATMAVEGPLKGWTEALQLMKAGSKWELFIPPELAYGKRQYRSVPPNSVLIFEMELLSINKETANSSQMINRDGGGALKSESDH